MCAKRSPIFAKFLTSSSGSKASAPAGMASAASAEATAPNQAFKDVPATKAEYGQPDYSMRHPHLAPRPSPNVPELPLWRPPRDVRQGGRVTERRNLVST